MGVYKAGDAAAEKEAREMFTEQVRWAIEEGVDFILGETFANVGEARVAAEVCKSLGVPSVMGLAFFTPKENGQYGLIDFDGSPGEACKLVRDAGADLVGPNCHQGPATIVEYIKDISKHIEPHRIATWPVAYRTPNGGFSACLDQKQPFPHLLPKGFSFPTALEPFLVTRYEFGEFAKEAQALGIKYMGGCCGMGPHHMRAMAEGIGRQTAASEYSADMSKRLGRGRCGRQSIESCLCGSNEGEINSSYCLNFACRRVYRSTCESAGKAATAALLTMLLLLLHEE